MAMLPLLQQTTMDPDDFADRTAPNKNLKCATAELIPLVHRVRKCQLVRRSPKFCIMISLYNRHRDSMRQRGSNGCKEDVLHFKVNTK